MKKVLAPFFLFFCHSIYAQSGTWVWMKGTDTANNKGNYGTMGLSSVTNEPPAREGMGFWTDTAGNFWMYGGDIVNDTGAGIYYADLWKFDPVSLMWTWENGINANDTSFTNFNVRIAAPKGVYDTGNSPGSTGGMITWTTPDNHLWFFGSDNNNGYFLWQYNPAINQWAYMGTFGPPAVYGSINLPDTANQPGERFGANSNWVDTDGNLWLFGGNIGGLSPLNDLWKYGISTGIWTWMGGSDTLDSHGSYGTVGVPSVNNYPWSRTDYFSWEDDSGNFWLTSGVNNQDNRMQDVWKFNPQTLEWTWVSGPRLPDDSGAVGSKCDTSYLNKEGGRFGNSVVWKVCDDLILNFGGIMNFDFNPTYYDDLWGYIPSRQLWFKLAEPPPTGPNHGIQGVASPLNYPFSRAYAASFVDKTGGLWMFGGSFSTESASYFYSDMWKYTIDSSCMPVPVCNITTGINGVSSELMQLKIYPNPAIDYTIIDYGFTDWSKAQPRLEICNALGQVVYTQELPMYSGFQKIDLSGFAAGMYTVYIKRNNAVIATSKLVKE